MCDWVKSIIMIIDGYHMVVGVEEVCMIGKPTEAKHNQHNDEHLGQLKMCNMIRIMIH